MVEIVRSIEIPAPRERVWAILSDWSRETEFWRGVVAVRERSTSASTIERDVTIAFRKKVQRERVDLAPPASIVHHILSGPMRGTKSLRLEPLGDRTRLTVTWDIRFVGFFLRLFGGRIARHIATGTEAALGRIATAVGQPPSSVGPAQRT